MLSNFNYYGFIVGLAVVASLWLWEWWLQKINCELKSPNRDWTVILIFMTIGSRMWHVVTDWYLYEQNFFQIFALSRGGLSILGALLGLVLGLWLVAKMENLSILKLLDLIAFVMPIGQAIGRFGNYFNQELYGWPTNLPWAITIEGQRVHPLFLYESIGLIFFWFILNLRHDRKLIGSGKYFVFYLIYYLVLRFFLDFLRVQKSIFVFGLGLNQVVILLLLSLIVAMILYKKHDKTN